MDTAAADPLVGRTIGQYEVVAKLGGGGMGVVYSARDTRLGRLVALKFLPPQWSHDDTAKQRFIREAQAASATDHRNICTIHDIGAADDGQLFIVMAHYQGETLKQRLERGPLSVDEAVDVAAQVAEGLAKAHAQGVVHRDIKPGNLMLTDDGVKILDFGLAKFADALQLTIAGSTLGTVAYMSPEQARAEETDARSDIWAVGIVLYEMLAGAVPFKGTYAEAIAHAIRTDPAPPIARADTALPEALLAIITRALQKDPADRYQSARELARDLRLLQGRTLPIELRTGYVSVAAHARAEGRNRSWLRRPVPLAATVVLIAALIGIPLWIFAPVTRVPVAVVPVVNQTGYSELDAFRLALTEELIHRLRDSYFVRPASYPRLLEIVRRFQQSGQDPSNREALQTIAKQTDARLVIVPTLLYEGGGWKLRIELREPGTGTNRSTYETPQPSVSALMNETVYQLVGAVAPEIENRLSGVVPRRASIAAAMRGLMTRSGGPTPAPTMGSLAAAAAMERALSAYEQQEYADAREAFVDAARLDPRNPLPTAWHSRVSRLMRQDQDAADAGSRAAAMNREQLIESDRLFVDAVVAESRGDFASAETRYRQLVGRYPDDYVWATEYAAFRDRRDDAREAVEAFHRALTLDSHAVRPHLELCRLYSPSRLNEPALAKEQGQLALAAYRAAGDQGGEAQALWCLVDVLRAGTDAERREARADAEQALGIVQRLGYKYGLARAYNYLGVVALLAERNGREAAMFFEQALERARQTGNRFLEPRLLMNLGVSSELFGERGRAVNYYQESFRLFESMGIQQQAAWSQANEAALLVMYGPDIEKGARDARNALGVFEKLGDKFFEIHARRTLAWYDRYTGRPEEALRELTIARGIANERNLEDRVVQVTTDLAGLQFDANDYVAARDLLNDALKKASGTDRIHVLIDLARTNTRLGAFQDAETLLHQASAEIEELDESGSLPSLYLAEGELAYESNRSSDARSRFERSADLWRDDMPPSSSVEARAYLGLLTAQQGQPARGAALVNASLNQARKMGRFALEARCRMFLARIDMAAAQPTEALGQLTRIAAERDPALGPELASQVHYWRGQALARNGDAPGAEIEAAATRKLLEPLVARVPAPNRAAFRTRPDIRLISGA